MSTRLKLDMSVEDGVITVKIETPGLDTDSPPEGSGATLIEAVEHLYTQLKAPEYNEERFCIGNKKMRLLERLIKEERDKKQIREEVAVLERMGIREAWAFTKSDLKDKVLVVAVPPISQHQYAQMVNELRRLLEGLFPDEDECPTWMVIPENFTLGAREPEKKSEW